MTNPRDDIDFRGIGYNGITMNIDNDTITYDATLAGGSSVVGRAVTISADKTVALCADGDAVFGKLIVVEPGLKCTVQYTGACRLPGGLSATLTPMSKIVGALGASSAKGYIRSVDAAAGSYAQAEAVEAQKARHTILNSATTTAVDVLLD